MYTNRGQRRNLGHLHAAEGTTGTAVVLEPVKTYTAQICPPNCPPGYTAPVVGQQVLTAEDLAPPTEAAPVGARRAGETIEQWAFRIGKVAPSSVPLESPVVIPEVRSNETVVNGTITYSPVYNIPSKLPYLAGPNMTINSLTKAISESTARNPEMEYFSRLFNSGLTADQIATVRGNVAALQNIDAMTLQRQKYQEQQRTAYATRTGTYAPALTPVTLSEKRMAAQREEQLRAAMFASSGADIAFYDESRRFRPTELQEQEMAERRGEASANQVYESDNGDVATYANGQAVAPPGGIGVPRPGDGAAPGGAAALTLAGLIALMFLA